MDEPAACLIVARAAGISSIGCSAVFEPAKSASGTEVETPVCLNQDSVCLWKPIRSVMGSGNAGVPRPSQPVHSKVERDSVSRCGLDGLGGFITSRHRAL